MKVIILTNKDGAIDFDKFGAEKMSALNSICEVRLYDHVENDFANVSELLDVDEKIVLYDPMCFSDWFECYSRNMHKFVNVKYLLSPYSFYDGLDLSSLKEMGIRYRNNAGANARSVAQHAITISLMLVARFAELAFEKHSPDGSILGEEIFGKTASIVGMGHIGIELLPLLTALGLKVKYYNRTDKKLNIPKVDLAEAFDSELIYLAMAPAQTRALMSPLPNLIKPWNYLIDTSATDDFYDKKAVLGKLLVGELKGYGLEVEDTELLVSDKKCNLITTPHMAWATVDAERRKVENYLERAIKIASGRESEIDFVV